MLPIGRVLTAAACLAVVASLAPAQGATTGTPVPSPAAASPAPSPAAPSGLRFTARTHHSLTLDWTDQPGAVGYHVQIAGNAAMVGARNAYAPRSATVLDRLGANHRYFLRVRGMDAARRTSAPWSVVVSGVTSPPPPPAGLRVAAVTFHSLTLDWADQPGAAAYHVQLSRTVGLYPSTDTVVRGSITTVYGLNPSLNYVFRVRGVDSAGGMVGGWTPVMVARTAPAPAAPASSVMVASYNVRCALCFSNLNEEKPWTKRRDAVVAHIMARRPDVLGLQEASQGLIPGTRITQFADLRARLNGKGGTYALTNSNAYNCRNASSPRHCVRRDRGASQGTRIAYNTKTLELLSQGSKLLPSCDGCNPRYLAWGIFRQRATGKTFVVANIHTQWMARYADLRAAEMRVAMDEVARRNPRKLPVFVVGDFNSTRYQAPRNAPYDEVIRRGFIDPLGHTPKSPIVSRGGRAEIRIRANYNSHNNFIRRVAHFAEWENGSNLDYILTTPMRILRWETVLDVDGRDQIRGTIPSDHNMILIRAVLP